MKISNANDLYDSASDLASRQRRIVSDIDVPDFSGAADSVAELAGDVVDFAGDAASVVGTRSRRGARSAMRTAQRNPKMSIGVAVVVIAIIAYLAARRSSKSDRPTS